jgi:hypothetical protein
MSSVRYTVDISASVLLSEIEKPLEQWTNITVYNLHYACMNCGGPTIRSTGLAKYPAFLEYMETHTIPIEHALYKMPSLDVERQLYTRYTNYTPPSYTTANDALLAYMHFSESNPGLCKWC